MNRELLFSDSYQQEHWDEFLSRCFQTSNVDKAIPALKEAKDFYGSRIEINWSLALCYLRIRNFEQYENMLNNCIKDEPEQEPAYLLLGELYSKKQQHDKAREYFAKAYHIAPTFMGAVYYETASPVVKNSIALARAYTHQDYTQGIKKILSEYRGQGDISRLKECFHIFLGNKAKPSTEKFNPETLYFPEIRQQQYYSKDEFPQLALLAEKQQQILEEYESIDTPFADYINLHSNNDGKLVLEQFKDFDKQTWHSYHLYRFGKLEENCAACPVTTETLETIGLPDVNGFMPEAFFSRLGKGSKIPPHHGLSNVRLAVHWPVIINDNCFIEVGGEKANWTLGEPLIFDDSYLHLAENHADEDRIVLIFDVWHPDLTEIEKQGIKKLFEIKTITNYL